MNNLKVCVILYKKRNKKEKMIDYKIRNNYIL